LSPRLDGKVAVITGTGDGQARTAALRFAAEGATVVGCDINEETASETLRLVREAGGKMDSFFPLDLIDEQKTHDLMEYAAETHGGIDILYNNAMRFALGTAEDLTLDDFNWSIAQTLTIDWLTTKHAIPHFRKRGGGSIINIASVAGLSYGAGTSFPGNLGSCFAYNLAKAAVLRMTTTLAVDLAPIHVRVNAISPGPINTPMAAPIYGSEQAPFYAPYMKQLLVDRVGREDDIVNLALYLASDESSFMTGSNLICDGGITASGGLGRPDAELDQVVNGQFASMLNTDTGWTTVGERAPGRATA